MVSTEYTGKRILELRQSQGLTQKQLAEKLNVTDKAVSKWERGINYPDLSLMEPLAKVLGTHVADLLGLENSVENNEALEVTTKIWLDEKAALKTEFRQRVICNIVLTVLILIFSITIECIECETPGNTYILSKLIISMCGLSLGNCIWILKKSNSRKLL
jgi:transcriptional regulator with XRE-family HTH domain